MRCSPTPASWRRASADATAQARLLHYRGLDALNQGQLEQALTLLTQADAAYAAEVPADALAAQAAADPADQHLHPHRTDPPGAT